MPGRPLGGTAASRNPFCPQSRGHCVGRRATLDPPAMRRFTLIGLIVLAPACSTGPSIEPSLAPRAAEAIDPRVPIAAEVPHGTLDAGLADQLRARETRERLNAGRHDAVADTYRELVDRYYQSLAAPRRPVR